MARARELKAELTRRRFAEALERAKEDLESAAQQLEDRARKFDHDATFAAQSDALRDFADLFTQPFPRALYLGLAYEQMDELEKAQEAYAEYLDIWKDADPELEPLKEQARVRLEAILAQRG